MFYLTIYVWIKTKTVTVIKLSNFEAFYILFRSVKYYAEVDWSGIMLKLIDRILC